MTKEDRRKMAVQLLNIFLETIKRVMVQVHKRNKFQVVLSDLKHLLMLVT